MNRSVGDKMYDWILLGQIEYQERVRRAESRNNPARSGWLVRSGSKSGGSLRNAARTLVKQLKRSLAQARARSEEQVGGQAQPSIRSG